MNSLEKFLSKDFLNEKICFFLRYAFQISLLLKHGLMRSKRKTGPSLQIQVGPNWQCSQNPAAHFILRSIEMYMLSSPIPRFCKFLKLNRIMTSGPQIIPIVCAGSKRALAISDVTAPT